MIKIVIIEDEILAQQELGHMLEKTGFNYEVVATLRSVSQGIHWLTQHKDSVDLIFADIELLDGQCFKIFEAVPLDVPVIFLTAYNVYALEAFKVNSIDYLLKPLELDALHTALEKYQRLQRKSNVSLAQIQQLMQAGYQTYKSRITIKTGDTYRHIDTADAAYFLADSKMVYLVTREGNKYIVDHSLSELEAKLDPRQFFRATRKYLIHVNAVKKATKYFHSRLKLTLDPPPVESVLISRIRVSDFLQWMDMD